MLRLRFKAYTPLVLHVFLVCLLRASRTFCRSSLGYLKKTPTRKYIEYIWKDSAKATMKTYSSHPKGKHTACVSSGNSRESISHEMVPANEIPKGRHSDDFLLGPSRLPAFSETHVSAASRLMRVQRPHPPDCSHLIWDSAGPVWTHECWQPSLCVKNRTARRQAPGCPDAG